MNKKLKKNFIIGIALGIVLIITAIIVGIITENDIGFVFAGIGTSIIGISILIFINKNHKSTLSNKEENKNDE